MTNARYRTFSDNIARHRAHNLQQFGNFPSFNIRSMLIGGG